MDKDNAALVRELFALFNAKEWDRLSAMCAPGALFETVPLGAAHPIVDNLKGWARAFPDATVEVRRIVAEGPFVVAEIIGRGTQTGPLAMGETELPPTNRRGALHLCDVYECRDGRIVGGRGYFDQLELMRSLGVQPSMGAPMGRPAGSAAAAPARH